MGAPKGMMPGREKGVAIASAPDKELSYWINRIQKDLAEGNTPDKYAASEQAKLVELQAEVQRRAAGGARAAAPAGSSAGSAGSASVALMTRQEAEQLAGTFPDTARAMQVMREAASKAFLITSQTTVPQLPHGCEMAFSVVWVEPETETYAIEGDLGLTKDALNKIASAAGVSWDAHLTGRLDNGRDPFYVHYQACARIRRFDGSERTEIGHKEIDLRDGSQDALDFYASAEAKDKAAGGDPKKMAKRAAGGVPFGLAIARKFILGNAETKAMNRAIRRLGVRTKYKQVELETKPFVIATVLFTGRSDNPVLEARFADKIADAYLGARASLYGGAPGLPPGSSPPALPARHDPPPLGSTLGDPGNDDDDWRDYESSRGAIDTTSDASRAAPASASSPKQTEIET
jgi:hypothetical protein